MDTCEVETEERIRSRQGMAVFSGTFDPAVLDAYFKYTSSDKRNFDCTTGFELIPGEDCWDGVNSAGYAGRVSTTSSGITCQAWASDFPNSHSRHEDYYFPHDGTDDAASNYCRDPEGSYGAPWCYTTNDDKRKRTCNIPICSKMQAI
ncbi:HGF-like protein [Mya arenaria]|uniref:HGF-like protein n=1 Tax=Mya arenaria TaxID=6604 RepID=A0ABY7EQC2_MYAAR|nr:HGF-like protein [Mya arenaria]